MVLTVHGYACVWERDQHAHVCTYWIIWWLISKHAHSHTHKIHIRNQVVSKTERPSNKNVKEQNTDAAQTIKFIINFIQVLFFQFLLSREYCFIGRFKPLKPDSAAARQCPNQAGSGPRTLAAHWHAGWWPAALHTLGDRGLCTREHFSTSPSLSPAQDGARSQQQNNQTQKINKWAAGY